MKFSKIALISLAFTNILGSESFVISPIKTPNCQVNCIRESIKVARVARKDVLNTKNSPKDLSGFILKSHMSEGTDMTFEIRKNVDKIIDILKKDAGIVLTQDQKVDFMNYINQHNFVVRTPKETQEVRKNFNKKRDDLKILNVQKYLCKQGINQWPVYKEDVYSKKGKIVSKKGAPVQFHHIIPIKDGGHNVAENGVPIYSVKEHSNVHKDLEAKLCI